VRKADILSLYWADILKDVWASISHKPTCMCHNGLSRGTILPYIINTRNNLQFRKLIVVAVNIGVTCGFRNISKLWGSNFLILKYSRVQHYSIPVLAPIYFNTIFFGNRYNDWLRAGPQRSRSSSPSKVKNFPFSISSRAALGSTQLPIKWLPGTPFFGVKWLGRETDHSPSTNAEVKKRGSIHPFPHKFSWRGA
jgi:hypothetical protein